MAKVRIDVYEHGAPSATITIPVWLLTGAAKVLPGAAGKKLQEHIDLDQIAALAKDPKASGVLLEIEDHKDGERVTISIVGDDASKSAL